MTNLIDAEEYDHLYFSDKVSPTVYPEKFDFKQYRTHTFSYIQSLSIEHRKLTRQLLDHYISIVGGVYGKDILEHIPSVMEKLLIEFDILPFNGKYPLNKTIFYECYREMIRKPRKYECENVHFYTKSVRTIELYEVLNRLVICRSTKPKPRMLKQLAAEVYINSKHWIYASILDLIQHNFNDMVFTNNFSTSYFSTFYDILLIKFVFQYFLKRNDTNFPVFNLICKCSDGFKNKNHVQVEGGESFSIKNLCILCNSIKYHVLKNYVHRENKRFCLCED